MPTYSIRDQRTLTILSIVAIPLALFSQFYMQGEFLRTIANVLALGLIVFAWHTVNRLSSPGANKRIGRAYLIGLLIFSVWLSLHIIIRSTYESSWHNSRNAFLRSFCLKIELFVVAAGLIMAVLFIVLCLVKILSALQDHYRRIRELKESNG